MVMVAGAHTYDTSLHNTFCTHILISNTHPCHVNLAYHTLELDDLHAAKTYKVAILLNGNGTERATSNAEDY